MEYLKKKDAAWLLYYLREHVDFDSFKKWLYDGKKQKKPFVDYVEFKKKQ